MWKIAVAFAVFAGLALFILSKGGDIHLGGESAGSEAHHIEEAKAKAAAEAAAKAASGAAAAAASAPAAAASDAK